MISGLASLIFGNGQQQTEIDVETQAVHTPEVKETYVDDDWVLFSQSCSGKSCYVHISRVDCLLGCDQYDLR